VTYFGYDPLDHLRSVRADPVAIDVATYYFYDEVPSASRLR